MLSIETITLFFTASVLLSLSPGPDNIFVLLQSAQRGWRAGIACLAAFELDRIGHQKKPPLIGVLVGRMVMPGSP